MRKIVLIVGLIFGISQLGWSQVSELEQFLKSIPEVSYTKVDTGTVFNEFYKVELTQLLDHKNPEGETFKQRIFVSLKGKDRPVVLITEGYNANRATRPNHRAEITEILDANQVFVEHRYFGTSFPDSLNYDYLTIEQAANDHHRVVELLKPFFTGKWVNSGISKGGQTTMYHRYYFPNDVDVSVPYVGPLMFSRADERFYEFFDTVGTPECREAIHNFQALMLKKKSDFLPKFIEGNKEGGHEYRLGYEHGYELMVLEYAFSFWQWGHDCNLIPNEQASNDSIYRYFNSIVRYGYLTEPKDKEGFTFNVQAMKDFGYYGYDTEEFKDLLDVVKDFNYDFNLPKGLKLTYDPSLMKKVEKYLQTEGDRFLYIYGGDDPYTSQRVALTGESNAVTFIQAGGSHRARIRSFSPEIREEIISKLEEWLEMDITYDFSN